ncbi:hypothetical protein MML48_5g00011373 [Holotrichia oblita]|uniref:Uncharacterized protein n=1 Tax=Holotrichia oblita TaxID=644536 RepID=A0ACB9T2C8_HOLOL|nr:hypothetical protein MML48_5g00011373 [Holotrichia oblita]
MNCLEEDNDIQEADVNILPPENGNETGVDSDGSDDEHSGDVNHLPRRILYQPCEIVSVNDDEFEPDDPMPLSELQKNEKAQRKTYQKSTWVKNPKKVPDNDIVIICNPLPCSAEAANTSTPIDLFKLFLMKN